LSKFYKQVGQNIKFYRKFRNYTQEELAHMNDLDQPYLSRIERGEINLSLDTIEKIANSLRVQPNQFFDRQEKSESERTYLEKINLMLDGKNSKELRHIQRIINEILLLKESD
jgi:transcriptional regulator with XRE-family HTH domain